MHRIVKIIYWEKNISTKEVLLKTFDIKLRFNYFFYVQFIRHKGRSVVFNMHTSVEKLN